jgi:type II restriction/modification system DNA methylase subunit YeeA
MGVKAMNNELKQFAKVNYPNSKSDLFSMVMERGFSLAMPNGYTGMITMQSWMFLSSYDELRNIIVSTKTFLSMAHLGAQAFDTIGGAVVQSTAFVLANATNTSKTSPFFRLIDGNSEAEKSDQYLAAIAKPDCGWFFRASADDFKKIPGSPIAYWISERVRTIYSEAKLLEDVAEIKQGLATCDNNLFLRQWFEVDQSKTCFGAPSRQFANSSGKKWFPYTKGGGFRKWYGNHEYLVNWEGDGLSIHNYSNIPMTYSGAPVRGKPYYFREGITYGLISSYGFSARRVFGGAIFDVGGSMIFPEIPVDTLLGFLGSTLARDFLSFLNPTLNYQVGDVCRLPILPGVFERDFGFDFKELVRVAQSDWDNFETSWDFRDQPLLRPGLKGATLEASWRNWEAQSTAAIRRMQELETENNRLFIAAYGLDGELQPEVPEDQITLARAEARRDMAAFLSYAVGCMMGRYSLDAEGLICANSGDTVQDYLRIVNEKRQHPGVSSEQLTVISEENWSFTPDDDAIIPVLEGEWFEDDIVARTRDFLRATFGEATLKQNLRFIEDSLGKSLEKFFLTDFYKDHLQTYKKRPIYWLFQSPKKGFSALVYVHRYTKDTVNTLLNKYLRDYLKKLEARINHLVHVEATATATKEKTAARKESEKLRKDLKDCQDWERNVILPLAQQRLEIDLDDGVKVNYLKFEGAVQAIPGLAAKED